MVSMKDEDFEKSMDKWAAHEVESASQLRPTEEMYRTIEARKRKGFFPVHAHGVLVGVSAVCFLLSLVVLPVVLRRSDRDTEPSIGLRGGISAEKGVIVKNPPRRGKGPKKGSPIQFDQLMFQYQKAYSSSVYGVDLRFPIEEEITLSTDDNYRLAIQPADDRYVYIYKLDSRGRMDKLFPNDVCSSARNPLEQKQTYHVPSEPNWLYPVERKGEESIYVIASALPMPELENLYNQYSRTESKLNKQESLSILLKRIEAVGQDSGEEAAKWMFSFKLL